MFKLSKKKNLLHVFYGGKQRNKYFDDINQYYKFCKKDNIKILNVTNTHNYKIKVTYVIIK